MTERYIVDDTQNEWDETYASDSFRHKNKYPNPEIINFVMKSFGNNHAKNKIKGDYAYFGPSVKFTWICLK